MKHIIDAEVIRRNIKITPQELIQRVNELKAAEHVSLGLKICSAIFKTDEIQQLDTAVKEIIGKKCHYSGLDTVVAYDLLKYDANQLLFGNYLDNIDEFYSQNIKASMKEVSLNEVYHTVLMPIRGEGEDRHSLKYSLNRDSKNIEMTIECMNSYNYFLNKEYSDKSLLLTAAQSGLVILFYSDIESNDKKHLLRQIDLIPRWDGKHLIVETYDGGKFREAINYIKCNIEITEQGYKVNVLIPVQEVITEEHENYFSILQIEANERKYGIEKALGFTDKYYLDPRGFKKLILKGE